MSRTVIVLVIVAVVALVLAALFWNSGVAVQVESVRRGAIREFVDERATTRLERTWTITMPFEARLEAISLKEGDRVSRGQVVARLVPEDLEQEVAVARAAVEQLAARIAENDDNSIENSAKRQADLFVESMQSTVAAAEARLTAGKSQLDYSESFLGRIRNLVNTGATSRDQLESAELDYVKSQVSYRQDALTVEALKALQAAADVLPRIITDYIGRKSLTRQVLEQQQAEAQARLRQALTRQQRGEMTSPVAGVVLERAMTNERHVPAGTMLLRIGQLDELEVAADILSEDVVRIRVGQPVEIYGPAVGADVGGGVAGRVERIFPAGFTKLSSLGVEQQRVTVIIRFADGLLEKLLEQHQLGVDYRVRVRIFTRERDEALLAPRSALFRGPAGKWQVFVIRNGRAQLTEVVVGLMNDERAEITEGLQATDTVILAPDAALRSGTRVRPE